MSTTSDPDRIEQELDRTRSRLSGHLDALQDRFSPGQVLDDVMGYFRGSEGADVGRTLLDSVRANPLPAAITGIGLAWLMATNPRGAAPVAASGSKVRIYRGPSGYDATANYDATTGYNATAARVLAAEQGVTRQVGEAETAYSARLDDARGQALGLARQAQETAESYGARIGDAMAAAKQAVTEKAHDLRDQVAGAAASVGETAQGAAQSVVTAAQGAMQKASGALAQGRQSGGSLATTLMDNPVLLGALGLAAGALLGAMLPQSDEEEAALGSVADKARGTARSLAQEVVDHGARVAGAVRQAGQESVQGQGLAGGKSAGDLVNAALSGNLSESVKTVASDVLRAGDEALRKEVPKAG